MPHHDDGDIVFDRAFCEERNRVEGARLKTIWERYQELVDEHCPKPPSLEERADRCKQMGLVLCTCTGVDRGDQPRLLIYDPRCEVHGKVA